MDEVPHLPFIQVPKTSQLRIRPSCVDSTQAIDSFAFILSYVTHWSFYDHVFWANSDGFGYFQNKLFVREEIERVADDTLGYSKYVMVGSSNTGARVVINPDFDVRVVACTHEERTCDAHDRQAWVRRSRNATNNQSLCREVALSIWASVHGLAPEIYGATIIYTPTNDYGDRDYTLTMLTVAGESDLSAPINPPNGQMNKMIIDQLMKQLNRAGQLGLIMVDIKLENMIYLDKTVYFIDFDPVYTFVVDGENSGLPKYAKASSECVELLNLVLFAAQLNHHMIRNNQSFQSDLYETLVQRLDILHKTPSTSAGICEYIRKMRMQLKPSQSDTWSDPSFSEFAAVFYRQLYNYAMDPRQLQVNNYNSSDSNMFKFGGYAESQEAFRVTSTGDGKKVGRTHPNFVNRLISYLLSSYELKI